MLPREIFTAAKKGDITAVQEWLAEGGDPNEGLEQAICLHGSSLEPGSTLLMAAASAGHLGVVRRLVEAGADVNVRVARSAWAGGVVDTALICAVSRTSVDCVEYLLARGAETSGIVDGTRIICNKNAMLYDLLGSPRIVRMLLAKGLVLTTARFDNFFNYGSLEESAKERARHLRRDSRPDKANR